jgi:DNA polymerase-1
MKQLPENSIFLIDGHSLLFRAFFGLQHLSTKSGTPTNVVYGFHQILQRLMAKYKPQFLAIVLDAGRESFRNDMYADYKANRSETPPEFLEQMPLVEKMMTALRFTVLKKEGFEADDIIATLCRRAREEDLHATIVSADKDLFQLVNDHVFFLRSTPDSHGKEEVFDADAVEAKMGVRPERMCDFQAIVGDSVDNIPGIAGLGPKFALQLLGKYPGGIDEMYADEDLAANLKAMKGFGPSKVKAVTESRELAELSYKLAQLKDDVEVELSFPTDLMVDLGDRELLSELYEELEFKSLLRDLEEGKNVFLGGSGGGDSQSGSISKDASHGATKKSEPGEAVSPWAAYPKPDVPKDRTPNYRAVQTEVELTELATAIKSAGHFAFDTETSGVSAMEADMVGISLSYKANEGVYIPVGHQSLLETSSVAQPSLDLVREHLGPIFADEQITKSAHHAKYDIKILERHGFAVAGLDFDTMVAAHLIDAGGDSLGLKPMALQHLGIEMQPIEELIGKGKNQISMAEVPIADATSYASADADCTLQLDEYLRPILKGNGQQELFETAERPLIDVLNKMEMRGIAINTDFLKEMGGRVTDQLNSLEKTIWKQAGREFNLKSPKQVAEVLFDDLGLKPIKKTKTGYSTNVAVLEMLRNDHEVVEGLLEYRVLDKLSSTYIEQLPKMVNKATGRIHCSFNQCGAATGRLSCNDPNLQNIPIRTEIGREIRRAFVASAEDRVLMSADYSQVELRLLAHVSGDETLSEAFRNDADIHRLTASKIYGVEQDEVTRDQRGAGKTINFGIVYGMSAFRLANDLNIDRSEGERFISEYFKGYPGVAQWIENTKEEARSEGYVSTMCGRRRYLPEIHASSGNRRAAAERVAVNTPIQGAAADLIKLAMIEVEKRLSDKLPECQMLLQVHDELVFDLPKDKVGEAEAIIREAMISPLELSVPLVVDIAHGASWAECK